MAGREGILLRANCGSCSRSFAGKEKRANMATKEISYLQLVKKMRYAGLYRMLQSLRGKKCWKVEFGFGGELHLHCGARISYDNPRMAGNSKGAWIFGTCGTPWHLVTPDESVSYPSRSEQELEPHIKQLEGATVTDINVSFPDGTLAISFNTKQCLFVTPTARDRRSAVPYWELFIPRHRLITFGPGNNWTLSRSNVPARRISQTSSGRMPSSSGAVKFRKVAFQREAVVRTSVCRTPRHAAKRVAR